MYGGAAGGGKSDALLMGALQYVDVPGYAAIIFRRTFADLALPGALMDRAHEWLGPTPARWNERDKTWHFPSGATLTFGYLDTARDKFRYQSAAFQAILFDELTQFPQASYRYLFSRLRRLEGVDIPLRMRAASNPGGEGHEWVRQRFMIEGPDKGRVFIPAKLSDNPYLDQAEYEASLSELDPITRRQLLDGDWSARAEGDLFRREWFQIVEEVPAELKWVRRWDLASTEQEERDNPDWTAGGLVGEWKGIYYIGDMRRARLSPDGVDRLVAQTAAVDHATRVVVIRMEQEPGAAGKIVIAHYQRGILKGYDFRGVPSSGSKVDRARPVSSAAEAGNVRLLAGTWIEDFLDEIEAFPNGSYDDQVDTISGAFADIMRMPHRETKSTRTLEGPSGSRYDRENNPLGLDLDDERYTDTDA